MSAGEPTNPVPEPASDPSAELPPELATIGVFATRAEAEEAGLVALATGAAYWILPREGGLVLGVEPAEAEAVGRQWALYREERSRRAAAPAGEVAAVAHPPIWPLLAGWVGLATIHGLHQESGWPIEAWARMDAVACLREREWWRPVTALLLHRDAGHWLANVGAGSFLGYWVARRWGWPMAVLLLLATGGLGNLLVALLVYPNAHLSLGASTAVFGALGLLTGAAVRERHGPAPARAPAGWIILAAGASLLGLFGVGGPGTDVAAHGAGFAVGLAAGWLLGRLGRSG